MPLNLHPPRFTRLRQFRPNILSFEKETYCMWCPESLCISQQLRKRLTGPGGDHIKSFLGRLLDAHAADFGVQAELFRDCLEKPALLLSRLIEDDAEILAVSQELGQHQARKPCAAA